MTQARPPIIVILGHVDHGKTTLLDYLRQSHVADREVGGITQSIRSFQIQTDQGEILTFVDTPGHAAFSQMRARGSHLADIALLIVAGNDGVMPQTKEAAEYISQSGIPYIVVITKSDLPESDPDRVKTQLTEIGIVVEDFGGEIPAVFVSAKTGQGIPGLLEMLDLMRQLHPPQADPDGLLEAVVLESRLDPKKGSVAEVVVKNGTLSVGQALYTAQSVGKVRALLDSENTQVKFAHPSTPVEILGLTTVPPVGVSIFDSPVAVPSKPKSATVRSSSPGSVTLLLKADVLGSLEAITSALDPQINLISGNTGDINENDVLTAKSSGAQIVSFNVKTPASVAKLAEVEHVPINSFRIIYELFDFIDGLVHPQQTEVILGRASVVAEFKIGPDRIAGCRVTEGQLSKGDNVRLLREDQTIGQTRFKSLQSGKTIIDKVKTGQEFGATLSPYLDFKVGDNIIAFTSHGST